MLTIDNVTYRALDWQQRFSRMERLDGYRNPSGKRYAVCLANAFDVLTIVLYVRSREGSVLLLHADTPPAKAAEAAVRGDCAYLVTAEWDNVLALPNAGQQHEPSLLQLSSGTTGTPKLIARTWAGIETEIANYNELIASSASEQPIVLAPVTHAYGLISGVLASLARGAQPAVVQGRNVKLAASMLRRAERPLLYAVPFVYNVLTTLERGKLPPCGVMLSGSPPPESLLRHAREAGHEVWQQYGSTETGCVSVARRPESPHDVGRPLGHYEILIRPAAADAERGRPEQGEIIVRAADGAAEAGEAATGDLGYIDARTGRLQLIGRIDDLIDVGGLLVAPAEVEAVIGRMRGIREAVVVKTRHSVWGEAVKALVVAEPSIEERDVRLWCMERLSAYQVPSVIELVESIPRMPSGKVSRKQIYERELIG